MKSILKSLLKTGLYFLEQSDRAVTSVRQDSKDRLGELAEQTRSVISKRNDHTLRNAITLVSGVAVGVGIAILFAPASGEQIRSSIEEKAQALRDEVRERFSSSPTTAAEEQVASGQ